MIARRWWVLAVVVFGLVVVILDTTVLNVALKTIADPHHGVGASRADLEWALNSYPLVFAGLLITFGTLGDRLGHKRIIIAGMAVFTVGSLIAAYAGGAAQLIAGRAVMGVGGAAIMPATLAIISHVVEPRERPKAIGVRGASVGVGAAAGPILVLLAEQDRHPELYRQYFDHVVAPRRAQVRAILQRGIDDGELRPDTDIETVLLCLSALQTRSKIDPDTVTPGAVERTVDVILHGILATRR